MNRPLDQETYLQIQRRGRAIVERLEALEAEARRLRGDLSDLLCVTEFELWLDVIQPGPNQSAQPDAAGMCAEVGESRHSAE